MNIENKLHERSGSACELCKVLQKEVRTNGKMGVYQFHGIGSPLFKVSPIVHRQFLEYLKENGADYWVTTFSNAIDYVTSKKTK